MLREREVHMIDTGWTRRVKYAAAALSFLALSACGSDSNLDISNPSQCGGGTGPQIRGVVQMPNGRVARAATLWERMASALVARVDALTGTASSVGRGVTVALVELRPADVAGGVEPGILETTSTTTGGEFCIGLRAGTDESVCRYVVQVGDNASGTLTRAFVYSTDEAIDIDFRSEATVRVILADIPPSSLCQFAPGDIRTIRQAVLEAPGDASGADADEVNAIAASIAAGDPGVRAAIADSVGRPPTPLPTSTSGPVNTVGPATPTATGPRPTSTRTNAPQPSRSGRATRTPQQGSPSPTRTNAPVTRTPTRSGSVTVPIGTATATRPPATNTVPSATATRTAAPGTVVPATATRTPTTPTPTPTATPLTGAGLGDRVFTIRTDSQYPPMPPNDPRSGFFASGLGGLSVSDKFTEGPLVLAAGVPNASGVATVRLKQDAYFKINVPPGNTTLCVKMVAAGSSGSIDCDGGTPYGVELIELPGNTPPSVPVTGRGTDSGAGAAQLTVMQAITEVGNQCNDTTHKCTITNTACTRASECINDFNTTMPCDATTVFTTPVSAVYTTANFLAKKGVAQVSKNGENFDCANWTMTNGAGMLVTGVVAVDERAGGNSANNTRLADR
jgi:hypothetical protein